jgi:hypothetical protein
MADKMVQIDLSKAYEYVVAGNSYFTMFSHKTGKYLSYTLKRKDSFQGKYEYVYFVKKAGGSENGVFLGTLFFGDNAFSYKLGKDTIKSEENEKRLQSLTYVLNHLARGDFSMPLSVYHHGKCGKCGRKLTTPESILTGLGPECSKMLGIPRVKVAQ